MNVIDFFIRNGYAIDISKKRLDCLLSKIVEKGYEWKVEPSVDGSFQVRKREYISETTTTIVDMGTTTMSYDEVLTLIESECKTRVYIVDESLKKITFVCDRNKL
jgi:hypothetical protein